MDFDLVLIFLRHQANEIIRSAELGADTDDDEFNLLVMSNTGYIPKSFSIEDGIIELR